MRALTAILMVLSAGCATMGTEAPAAPAVTGHVFADGSGEVVHLNPRDAAALVRLNLPAEAPVATMRQWWDACRRRVTTLEFVKNAVATQLLFTIDRGRLVEFRRYDTTPDGRRYGVRLAGPINLDAAAMCAVVGSAGEPCDNLDRWWATTSTR